METPGNGIMGIPMNGEFQTILTRIVLGHEVDSSEIVTFLLSESAEDRLAVNVQLTDAYASAGKFQQARVFIDRAWVLSKFSPEILPRLIQIHSALNDFDSIREDYKRAGMQEAERSDISAAIKYFNLWHYTYAHHTNLDKYEYDFDVLDCIERMAKPWRFAAHTNGGSDGRKIRLAYLTFGMTHENSVLSKINRTLAAYHNKDLFDVTFFVPESQSAVHESSEALQTIRVLRDSGCEVVVARNQTDNLQRLLSIAGDIHEYGANVMITSALLADLETYFIASLRPSPILIGLLQGPPAQFAAPNLDWAISWSKHPAIDAPCNCSFVQFGFDLPNVEDVRPSGRAELGIPANAQVIVSAGRYVKFQNENFWKSILEILTLSPKAYYVAVGVTEKEVPFFNRLCPAELVERIRLLGWRKDAVNILGAADVVIDTFPSGGGHILAEAMALGIPCVSFANDYLKKFDQTDWSVADEYIGVTDLVLPRGNFEQLKEKVSKLLADPDYRAELGQLCKGHIQAQMNCPAENVRKYEECICAIIRKRRLVTTESRPESFNKQDISRSYLTRLLAKFKASGRKLASGWH